MKDDVLSGMLLLFSPILILSGVMLLDNWRKTRDILNAGALTHAPVTGQEVREVAESAGSPPYYTVRQVNHLFVRLEIPGADGRAVAVWHDIGEAKEELPADRYLVRYRPEAPRQYRVVGPLDWSQLFGGVLLSLLGVLTVVVVIYRLSTGTPY